MYVCIYIYIIMYIYIFIHTYTHMCVCQYIFGVYTCTDLRRSRSHVVETNIGLF